jgi:NAD(P)H-hydrate epimerase
VTFHGSKVGLVVGPGRFHAGRVVVADIGLDDAATEIDAPTPAILDAVPRRAADDTKYSSGAVLVVGGQPGMTGAACLTAMAALRADAGYVTLAVPVESLATAEVIALEPVKIGWAEDDAVATITEAAERAGALALGPGLGRGRGRRELVRAVLERVDLPAVVDADALFELEPVQRAAPTVLTPHAGELGRLLGRESAWVGEHRLEAARAAADSFGATVLLKGADTLVAAPDGSVVVCDIGPPSLATAGTGDVLTGVVASFLSKELDAPHRGCRGCGRSRASRAARSRTPPASSQGISSPRFPLRSTPDAPGGRWRRMTAWSGRASPSI